MPAERGDFVKHYLTLEVLNDTARVMFDKKEIPHPDTRKGTEEIEKLDLPGFTSTQKYQLRANSEVKWRHNSLNYHAKLITN